MEEPDRERGKTVSEAGQQDDGESGPCPCSPELFAACWNRTLGPFRKKPFRDDNDLVGEIIRQEEALFRFAKRCRIDTQGFGLPVAAGAEHEVYVTENRERVWKITKRDRWGFKKDTPLDYLERLHSLTTHVESLDIKVEGVAIHEGLPRIVTSMAYIHGAHPSPRQLASKMKRDGFILIPDETGLLAYRNNVSGLVFRDAHPGNFIVAARGAFIPIDVAIEISDS